jgi:phosphoribosylanthranilate isomerase
MLKVCGMNNEQNVLDILVLRPQFLGFIFYNQSSRNCSLDATFIQKTDFGQTKKVGVFVNESISEIKLKHKEYGLDLVQLHGNESEEYCQTISELGISFIKAFSVDEEFSFEETKGFHLATYFLFDTKGDLPGGNGVEFNWDILLQYRGSTRFLLSGGIGPEHNYNAAKAIHAACAGVDINSKFEVSPGNKSVELVKEFIGQRIS